MSSFRLLQAAVCSFSTLAPTLCAQTSLGSSVGYLGMDDVEITPDQRYAVVRQNHANDYALVFDLATGLQVPLPSVPGANLCGDCLDAVAVTNERAIVLGGSTCRILDLTTNPPSTIAIQDVGVFPNDVTITPDGTIAAVRGGSTLGGGTGGQFLFDLATGVQLATRAGDPPLYNYSGAPSYSYDTDSVVASNEHVVMLSIIGQQSAAPTTRVTIWDLHPATPGPAAVVFETGGTCSSCADLSGAPHDVALSPDGLHAVVRSELEVALYALSGPTSGPVWTRRPFGGALGFADEALDSVEISNTHVATISRVTSTITQVDVFDLQGTGHYEHVAGAPHDLALTPDGTRAVVRTKGGVWMYDLSSLPPSQAMHWVASAPTASISEQYQAGLDSVAVSNRFAATLTQAANLQDFTAWFWSIERGRLDFLGSHLISNSRPIDVAFTPDGTRAVVSGTASVSVFHLATGTLTYEHHLAIPNNWFQWCDGVAASDEKAVAVGQWGVQEGWIDSVDMTPIYQRYCTSLPNSSGRAARILALGNASVADNSLELFVDDAAPLAHGRFVYGAAQTQLPFGDGVQCVATPSFGLQFLDTNLIGAGHLAVDYLAQNDPGGVITAGSTWHFQFVFRDVNSGGFGFNTSDALSIVFAP